MLSSRWFHSLRFGGLLHVFTLCNGIPHKAHHILNKKVTAYNKLMRIGFSIPNEAIPVITVSIFVLGERRSACGRNPDIIWQHPRLRQRECLIISLRRKLVKDCSTDTRLLFSYRVTALLLERGS